MFLLALSLTKKVQAQVDPTLAGMVLLYTEKAESELKTQEKAMMLETTGHIWIREEMQQTYDIQKKFNTYLDTFRGIVYLSAQIYGFYHEIQNLVGHMSKLTEQLQAHPTNTLAVALTPRRNQIYRDILLLSLDICNDIRLVCLSDMKMTEKERMEIVFGIRPKLKKMNKSLMRLTRAVKYTSLGDVWMEIDEGARPPKANIADIAAAAKRRWKQVGKNVKP